MRNWFLPIAVLGVCGMGLIFASSRGRQQLRQLFDREGDSEEPFIPFGKVLERELENIQEVLDQLSETLEAAR